MKTLRVKDILASLKGVVISGDEGRIIRNVTANPRKVKRKATLYFHFNHRVTKLGLRRIPKVIITENADYFEKVNRNITIVKVDNINAAYSSFINYYRNLFNIPVIGVTGTCGKTTTTEMIKKIISRRFPICSTHKGNNALANNLRYLLRFNHRTKAGVFEMGVSSPGTIQKSCAYFQPNIGIILNIGTYHLLGCETMEGYIKAKAEMLEGLKNNGTLIINADDDNIKKIDFSEFKGKIITVGIQSNCHYQAQNIDYAKEGMTFQLNYEGTNRSVFVPGYGRHNVYNALAALAATVEAGIFIDDAIKFLADFKSMRQHLQFREGINGCTIIDDTWNCTPPSIKAALQVLREKANGRKKVAVIGYMPQLGKNGEQEYFKVGESVVETGVDFLIVIGDLAKNIGLRALELGMEEEQISFCNTGDEVYKVLQPVINENTLLLFKFPYKYRLKKIPSFKQFMKDIFR